MKTGERLKEASRAGAAGATVSRFSQMQLELPILCPTIQKSQPESSTTGLIHPYEVRHLTISEIKLMSSFPAGFKLEGKFTKKWARVGNSVPPLLMKANAEHIRRHFLPANKSASGIMVA